MTEFLLTGILLGLSAGLAPGPLLTLVISETLQRGVRGGIYVALSPLVTDLPIILLTLFVLSKLSGYNAFLGGLSLLGGGVLLYMGFENMRTQVLESQTEGARAGSLLKGIIANSLNPHPYLFWLGVGGPLIGKSMHQGNASLFLFIGSFYLLLIGSKVILAILVGKSRNILQGRLYTLVMRLLGLALCLLALILFKDGLQLLGVF